METKILKPTKQNILLAAQLLAKGELVAIPTETVYGLAANALEEQAVQKIFTAKGRPQDNPLISHIANMDMLSMVNADVCEDCYKLASAFWPGPLTMIMKKSTLVAPSVCAGLQTAAVRMPSHPVAREIIQIAGVPLAAPSANISGRPSPTDAQTTMYDLQGKIPLVIDGGACEVGLESTVISLCNDTPVLLRPGVITVEQIENVLHKPVVVSNAVLNALQKDEKAQSPGLKYKHYAPKANVVMVEGPFDAFKKYVAEHTQAGTFCLCFDGEETQLHTPCVCYGNEDNPVMQAQKLFSALRQLDKQQAINVYARAPQKDGVSMAVYNRLLRAAAFQVVEAKQC